MVTSSHHHHHQPKTNIFTTKHITRALYILIPSIFLLHFYLSPSNRPPPSTTTNTTQQTLTTLKHQIKPSPPCNYTQGRWVPTPRGPLYNGTSCGTIKPGQNCMAHGRPDTGYLHWRWSPSGCRLRPFRPRAFLSLLRHKHLAFVGDSMARNQLESLLCLLSSDPSAAPDLVYRDGDDNKFRRWVFPSHNATVSVFWSPFLVSGLEKDPSSGLDHNELHLDSADEKWASALPNIDVLILSIGHWFLHPAVYRENGSVLGCHHCPGLNHTEIGFFEVFRKAVRTALREVSARHEELEKKKRFVAVTTFSPAHFEGEWDKAGACPRKKPYGEGEKEMEYMDAEMRRAEVEEVAAAAAAGLRVEALDVTRMAMMRPDGHPGPYMYPDPFAGGPKERVQNDCVHWCLPGPIDAWNEILYEMLRRWKEERN